MGQGGRHWNEWLSEEGSSYIEIQAGLTNPQLEHIPMDGNCTWEWVEAYTALDIKPDIAHGDYKNAVENIEEYMSKTEDTRLEAMCDFIKHENLKENN